MIKVKTSSGKFLVKNPKKIEWWTKLSQRATTIIVKEIKGGI